MEDELTYAHVCVDHSAIGIKGAEGEVFATIKQNAESLCLCKRKILSTQSVACSCTG